MKPDTHSNLLTKTALQLAGFNSPSQSPGELSETIPGSFAYHWLSNSLLHSDARVANSAKDVPNQLENLFSPINREKMREFFKGQFSELQNQARVVFYPFGGPDVLYPSLLFPQFERLVIVGRQSVGEFPNHANESSDLKSQVSQALLDLLRYGFFVTSTMARSIGAFGITTLIAVQLATDGCALLDLKYVRINAHGEIEECPNSSCTGVLISFLRANNCRAEVLYLQQDLSNQGLRMSPQFLPFLTHTKMDCVYYKAASFLPTRTEEHPENESKNFSEANSLVVNQTRFITQSDDGLALDFLIRHGSPPWHATIYGLYAPPLKEEFRVDPQPSLCDLYSEGIWQSGTNEDKTLWSRVWQRPCESKVLPKQICHLKWNGYLPFRYGYGGVSGPSVLDWDHRAQFGTLMLFQREPPATHHRSAQPAVRPDAC